MTIARSAAKGVSWSAVATLFKGGLQLVQLIILARILTPLELGLLAMINIVIGFAQIFGDAGISNATIFHKELKRKQLSQLYSVNLILGCFITFIVFISASYIEKFYSMNGLSGLLILLSPIFFIKSVGQQQQALLQQQLKFDLLARIEVIAASVGFGCLAVFLYLGLSLNAVIYSQLITAIILSLLLLFNRAVKPCIPAFPQLSQIIKPVKYGLYQTGEAFINYLSAQFDQLLIGKLLGAETLGIYSYIKSLVFRPALQLINPIVNRVTFPLMVNYKSTHSFSDMYSQVLRLLSFINIPLYGLIALFPELVLSFTFGDSWLPQAELLKWLAIYMLFISMMNPIGTLLRASGSVKRGFYWNLLVTIVRPLVILLSIKFGLVWLVKSLVLLQVFLFIGHWLYLLRPVAKMSFQLLILSVNHTVVTFTVAAVVVMFLFSWFSFKNDVLEALIIGFIYVIAIFPQLLRVFRFIKG